MGLYDYGARNYDPAIGRWLQVDPLAEHPSQIDKSPYAYGWNNPVKYDDPDGKCPNCAIGALIGGAVGFVGSVMAQSLEGEVDIGQALIDGGKGAVAGAIVGSGAGLIVAAAEATAAGGMMVAGGLSAGGAIVGEAAGQGVEIVTDRREEMNAEKIVATGAVAGATGMMGPTVEKSLSVVSAALAGPATSGGLTKAVTEVTEEAAEASLTKSVVATAETAVNTVSSYFSSFFSEEDD